MYEYKFERIELKRGFATRPRDDYHEVIQEHAKDGWRLVQIFAPATSGYGMAGYFEIIFEREVG